MTFLRTLLIALTFTLTLSADDGYRLWLRYDRIVDTAFKAECTASLRHVVLQTASGTESPTVAAARSELLTGLEGLLGSKPTITLEPRPFAKDTNAFDGDGYSLLSTKDVPKGTLAIRSGTDLGILYGAFDLLRRIQTGQSLDQLNLASYPKIQRRLLNHWDDLNRFVERGYSGFSLWEWFNLPEVRNPRYRDYARACASIGINGTVLTNVNANALILTPHYLTKVAALAEEFRPYGVRVYLTARFSAPIEIGGLKTADPLDPAVAAWWKAKIDEIYTYVPDFGGFLVKANSEGQPGPQDYQRNHADGANMLADALAPHHGIVMWRAFVYQPHGTEDRVKQASLEFVPLDGQFRDNVVIQIKNGPLDFMPREPFSPLFGQLKKTSAALELQITQEYLGGSTQLAYLAPLWKEVLDADTFAAGPTSTVARVVASGGTRPPDGFSPTPTKPTRPEAGFHPTDHNARATLTVIAGVANTGTDRNWTGHPLAAANWYAFGRLAWDHTLGAETIADEWTKLTFGTNPKTVQTITKLLNGSRETVVNYSMPLGLHHIMAEGHHYGPGPWAIGARPDWSAPYYHQADPAGLGANRGVTGSNALENYAPELRAPWGNVETCPENLLLWFHHLPWDHKMKSGRTLWDELCLRYQQGVDEVRVMQREWDSLKGSIDEERFADVQSRFVRQEHDARDWRDACLLYFQEFSQRPLPAGVEAPAHDLSYYKANNPRYVPGHPGDK